MLVYLLEHGAEVNDKALLCNCFSGKITVDPKPKNILHLLTAATAYALLKRKVISEDEYC